MSKTYSKPPVIDNVFAPDEYLFRRVHPDSLPAGVDEIEVDSLEMPDMSVNRQKYGPAELVIKGYVGWGIVKFRVREIPQSQQINGILPHEFKPVHAPLDSTEHGYPHSEIRAYRNGQHIDAKQELDRTISLRWREKLLRYCVIERRPDHAAYRESISGRQPRKN
jgi:hypothetical protein